MNQSLRKLSRYLSAEIKAAAPDPNGRLLPIPCRNSQNRTWSPASGGVGAATCCSEDDGAAFRIAVAAQPPTKHRRALIALQAEQLSCPPPAPIRTVRVFLQVMGRGAGGFSW